MEELDRKDQNAKEKDTTPITTSVRISPATKSQFNELVKELGYDNQDQLLNYLIRLHDMNEIKAGLPGRVTEIESFESHMNSLSEIYKGSLRTCQDAELRIEEKYVGNLRSNSETIQSLQSQLKTANTELESLKTSKGKQEKKLFDLQEEIQRVRNEKKIADDRCSEYKNKNDTMIDTVREYEEDHKNVGKLKEELMQIQNKVSQLEKSAEESEEKMNRLGEENKKYRSKIEELEKDVGALVKNKEALSNDITRQNEKHERELFKKDQEKAEALLDAREKYNEKLEEERKKIRDDYTQLLAQLQPILPATHTKPESTP